MLHTAMRDSHISFRPAMLMALIVCTAITARTHGTYSNWNEQEYRVNFLQAHVTVYYEYEGVFPATDAESSWFEKLCAAGHANAEQFGPAFGFFGIDPDIAHAA
jgi:hypothetical protein